MKKVDFTDNHMCAGVSSQHLDTSDLKIDRIGYQIRFRNRALLDSFQIHRNPMLRKSINYDPADYPRAKRSKLVLI